MRSSLLTFFLVALCAPLYAQMLPPHVPGEVLVLLEPGHSLDEVARAYASAHATAPVEKATAIGKRGRYGRFVAGGSGLDAVRLERALRALPGVKATTLNYLARNTAVPNDPEYADQWGLSAIGMEAAWDITTGGAMANGHRITVGIMDELVFTGHPDLAGNISPVSPHVGAGDNLHGTMVAGVVGAVGDNGIGVAGVNWDVDLASLGLNGNLGGAIEGFEAAIALREAFNTSNGANGALVVAVTASWTFPGVDCGFSDPLFADMADLGILVVTAGDNALIDLDTAPEYPSSCSNANNIVVTAIGPGNEMPFAFGNGTVHLIAPGIDIPTTNDAGGYQLVDGNSFAVPHVAGAIALLYSQPCAQFAQLVMNQPEEASLLVKEAILSTVTPVSGGLAKCSTGGMLNVNAALQELGSLCGSCDLVTVQFTSSGNEPVLATMTDASGATVATMDPDAMSFCQEDGCFTITLIDAAAQPVDGSFTVEVDGLPLTSGTTTAGVIPLELGTVIPGCMDPGSANFTGLANCEDGTCCNGPLMQMFTVPADEVSTGEVGIAVTHNGSVVYDAVQPIMLTPELGFTTAALFLCAEPGCYTITITEMDVPLGPDAMVVTPDGEGILFPVSTGFSGPLLSAEEVCDGIDNDCDGEVDEDFVWYADNDGDEWGDASVTVQGCEQPVGSFVTTPGDCNDNDATIFPGASDSCTDPDGVDNDCNGTADDQDILIWFADNDGDGVGVEPGVPSCEPLAGHVLDDGDCDDNDLTITAPGMPCDDGNPNTHSDTVTAFCECQGILPGSCPDGQIPDCNGNCAPIAWLGDGICDDGIEEWEGNLIFFDCEEYNFDLGDCEGSGCPGELCDGIDNDCDGLVDEDFLWYTDADGDGFGDDATAIVSCEPVDGMVFQGGDCDDADPAINPLVAEVCDGVDNNCDGFVDGFTAQNQSGCTDPMACNFDPNAVCADGSCVQGTTITGTETYSPNWTAIDTDGQTVELFALLEQGKTVVLDLFAAWCTPSINMLQDGFLEDWNAHMGPGGTDHIRIVQVAIDQSAGSLASFIAAADWPVIVSDVQQFATLYGGLGLYDNAVPTLIMICPDRSAKMIYPTPAQLPTTGLFTYDPAAAIELLNDKCGCRGEACTTNIGCMDINACDFDPTATCPGPCTLAQEWFTDLDGDGVGTTSLGTACTAPIGSAPVDGDCDDNDPTVQQGFTLYVFTNDPEEGGTAHYVIEQGGVLTEGDMDLLVENDGTGELVFCIPQGCFNLTITANDVQLYEEAALVFSTDPEDAVIFFTEEGFSTGTAEVCDGLDNDCDGEVDEELPQHFADNDGDGYGDPALPLGCSGGVPNADDCDDDDADSNPELGCGSCSSTARTWILENGNTLDAIFFNHVIACNSSGDLLACLVDAFMQNTPLPEGCATCVAQRYICMGTSCMSECGGNPSSAGCLECMWLNCNSDFYACAGFPDLDEDGVTTPQDCDDFDANVHPFAEEICDGIDNNCDGETDDAQVAYFEDLDDDGFGNSDVIVFGDCDQGIGQAVEGGDCDDLDPDVHPTATELCNGIDDDCNSIADDGVGTAYYLDNDGDEFGDDASVLFACEPIPGRITQGGDCNDNDPTIHPGAADPCDGIDQDCSGGPVLSPWFEDLDGDGFGTTANIVNDCEQPVGFAPFAGDCNDQDDTIFPGQGCSACVDADLAWIATHQLELIDMIFSCIGSCIGSSDPDCIENCLLAQPIPPSVVCMTCIDPYLVCAGQECGTACSGGPAACLECQIAQGCMAPFTACMGQIDADGDGYWAGSDCDDAQPAAHPFATEICDGIDNDCDGGTDEGCATTLSMRVVLDGPYNSGTGLMSDGMRALGLVPTVEPYTGLGYPHVGSGGETTTPSVLAVTGTDAIVDWVMVEVRPAATPAAPLRTVTALLQRDGDVVAMDGTSPLTFTVPADNYHLAVRHRNHLGCMTAATGFLDGSFPIDLDMADPSLVMFGTDARRNVSGVMVLWSGDVTFDGTVMYTGDGNDRDPILSTIGGVVPTTTVPGYHQTDVNMDGEVIYTGDANDRDRILQAIGGVVPTNTRVEQLP